MYIRLTLGGMVVTKAYSTWDLVILGLGPKNTQFLRRWPKFVQTLFKNTWNHERNPQVYTHTHTNRQTYIYYTHACTYNSLLHV